MLTTEQYDHKSQYGTKQAVYSDKPKMWRVCFSKPATGSWRVNVCVGVIAVTCEECISKVLAEHEHAKIYSVNHLGGVDLL